MPQRCKSRENILIYCNNAVTIYGNLVKTNLGSSASPEVFEPIISSLTHLAFVFSERKVSNQRLNIKHFTATNNRGGGVEVSPEAPRGCFFKGVGVALNLAHSSVKA